MIVLYDILGHYTASEESCHLKAVLPVPAVEGPVCLQEGAGVDGGDVVTYTIVTLQVSLSKYNNNYLHLKHIL